MSNLTQTEPVLTVATVTAAVSAVIALVVAFGVDLSTEQTAAILGIVSVVAPLVVIYSRRFVTPTGGDHRL